MRDPDRGSSLASSLLANCSDSSTSLQLVIRACALVGSHQDVTNQTSPEILAGITGTKPSTGGIQEQSEMESKVDAKQDWMPHKQGSSRKIHSPCTAIHT